MIYLLESQYFVIFSIWANSSKVYSVMKTTFPDSIFRRFGHFGNSFLNFVFISLFTMRRDLLQIISINPLNMDIKFIFLNIDI